ncbi:hypothetical protein NDU88_008315 [Pleurodeles waltl]|uniref:Uncharacterized protein n=1 Tax=Pleurodeles waltl TaxID=8319 RepID=A0AAV7P4Q4_PLEWA|nr:hypothetical protein NDU88_008315 [Pleurodeles waltl]
MVDRCDVGAQRGRRRLVQRCSLRQACKEECLDRGGSGFGGGRFGAAAQGGPMEVARLGRRGSARPEGLPALSSNKVRDREPWCCSRGWDYLR